MRPFLLAVAVPPLLLATLVQGRWGGVAVAGLVALALLAAARSAPRHAGSVPVAVLDAAAAVIGFTATALALDGSSLAIVLLAQAVVLAVVATSTGSRGPLVAALGYGLVGFGTALDHALPLSAVSAFPDPAWVTPSLGRDVPGLLAAIATALLLTAAAAATLHAVLRLVTFADPVARRVVAAVLGGVALYGAAGTVVAAAVLVAPSRAAFLTGHVLVTVSWAGLALVLLARGLRDSAPRVLGAVLVVAAVAKLVLFDLVALDGIARVAAFLGAGLVLLVAGTRYASLVAAEPATGESTEPASPTDGERDGRDGREDSGWAPSPW